MKTIEIAQDEVRLIRSVFSEIRSELRDFIHDREFELSNPQLITFLLFSPNTLAIAGDGEVDEKEIAGLEQIVKGINVKSAINLDLLERMSLAPEPDGCMINEEFNIRVGSELLYLCRNMSKYENAIINSIRILLKFDTNPDANDSLTKLFSSMMNAIVENNLSRRKKAETKKLEHVKHKIGINC